MIMEFILEYIGPVLGISSAVITITIFLKNKLKQNILLVLLSLVFASLVIYVWNINKEKQYDFELLAEKQKYEKLLLDSENQLIAKDAKSIAQSIVITSWTDYGDYLGYLSTMVGFYKRHSPKYEMEYNSLSKQLNEWQVDLREIRNSGKYITQSDYKGLIGLVESTKDYFEVIGNKTE